MWALERLCGDTLWQYHDPSCIMVQLAFQCFRVLCELLFLSKDLVVVKLQYQIKVVNL